jgi:hypothetical protein
MPSYEGTRVLTVGKAEEAKRAVERWFDTIGWPDAPAMYKPGHEGPMWVLSLEGGPEDWPLQVCDALYQKWPDGVFAEPVNSWCLGLYPATDPTANSEGERLAQRWGNAVAQGNVWAQAKVGAAMAKFLREH